MAQTRFGRRIALPSTRQIRHEMIMLMWEEARTAREREAPQAIAPAPVAADPAAPSN